MIGGIVEWILGNYSLSFLIVAIVCAGASLARHCGELDRKLVFETLLKYYCLFSIGCYYLYNFVVHVFFGEMAAKFIGWENSPFQLEVGFASLGFGVVGLLAYRQDFGLRLAAITGPAFFLWGAAGGHIYQMVAHHNFAPGNAGIVFWTDIFLPVIGFALLYGWRRAQRCCGSESCGTMQVAGG